MIGGRFLWKYFIPILPLKTQRQVVQWRSTRMSASRKVEWDLYDRPQYAYGTYQAAIQARALGIPEISVIEFGVAGGNGLVALEKIALEVEKETGTKIAVYGFDTGEGMPPPVDYRDLPYLWQRGDFKMDVEKLKRRLNSAHLILGNVSETIPSFINSCAPIGFISFDLDYYSSTVTAFKIFQAEDRCLLPRVFCFFDDCVGGDEELHCPFAGELLAIEEYNQAHVDRKISMINGLRFKRRLKAQWNDDMCVHHSFRHHDYARLVRPRVEWHLPLE